MSASLPGAISPSAQSRAVSVVLLNYPERALLEQQVVEMELAFPYLPGLLAFREVPVLTEAFRRLSRRPDLLLVDGQGLAHPRRLGIACHLGLVLDLPTIGCAKSRLVGEHGTLDEAAGSRTELRDGPDVIGLVLRTRAGVTLYGRGAAFAGVELAFASVAWPRLSRLS
jgi:deoxyribonuclease V